MTIKSVALAKLPTNRRELSAEDKATAAAIASAAGKPGTAATDGEVTTREIAVKTASAMRRLVIRANVVPAGMEARTRITPNGDGFSWNVHFAPAPKEPRTRKSRKASAE